MRLQFEGVLWCGWRVRGSMICFVEWSSSCTI